MAGANPALVVRVASTIEELRANLKQGVSQIETTTGAMQKLASSFSGDKLIQAAMNVTAAVNEIGGASKLTEAEQARVNATLEKALEKYALLGKEAPAGMRQLADETKGTDKETVTLWDTVKGLALGFAAMFTARAAFNFVKDTINEASALKDLSQQTHINVEELQLLAGGMSEFGVDADELGKGLYKLSRGIAGGDESVATGLHMMGMSLKDVEGLQGKELFLKIESGLATLQGGLRDTAAAELFGGKLGAAMAGASEGIEGALETWQRLNTVASGESIDALDSYGEAIDRTKASLSAMATNMMGPVAQGFNVITDAAGKGASKWDIFVAMTKDWAASNSVTGASTTHLATLLDELNQKTEAATAKTKDATAASGEHAAALTAEGQAAQFMSALQADATVALTAAQVKHLETLKELGQLNAKNAEGVGVSAAQFAKYKDEVEKAAAAQKKWADAVEEITSVGQGWKGTLDTMNGSTVEAIKYYLQAGVAQDKLATFYGLTAAQIKSVASALTEAQAVQKITDESVIQSTKLWEDYFALRIQHGGTATDAQLAQIDAWFNSEVAKLKDSDANWENHYNALESLAGEMRQSVLVDWKAIGDNSRDVLQQTADKAKATFDYMLAHSDQFTAAQLTKFQQIADAAQLAADTWGTSWGDNIDRVAGKLASASEEALSWSKAMDLVSQGQGTLGGTIEGSGGFDYSGVGGFAAATGVSWGTSLGFRASGGDVMAGESYVVGERGPEVLRMGSQSGTIIPNGAGSVVVNVTVNAQDSFYDSPASVQRLAEKVSAAVTAGLRNRGAMAA